MRWTEEKLAYFKEWYHKKDTKELSKELGVTPEALWIRAGLEGISQPTGTRWTEEKLAILRKWYGKVSVAELAKRFGVTEEAVKLKASRIGISQKRNFQGFKWTDDKVEALKQRYPTEPAKELAKEFGCHFETLRHKAASLGIRCLTGRKRAADALASSNTSLDIHYFDQWTPSSSWILGFLFADGSISKRNTDIIIGLSSKDECVLEFIKNELKATRKISRVDPYTDKNGHHHRQASYLYLGSQLLVQRLFELGLKRRKTYTDEPFPNIPNDMLSHFILGYFDGDGAAFVHKDKRWPNSYTCHLRFIGSPRFMEGLRDILVEQAGMTNRPTKIAKECKTPVARIGWSAHADLQKFYDFVYPSGYPFCLERKRKVLFDWLENKRNRELEIKEN